MVLSKVFWLSMQKTTDKSGKVVKKKICLKNLDDYSLISASYDDVIMDIKNSIVIHIRHGDEFSRLALFFVCNM